MDYRKIYEKIEKCIYETVSQVKIWVRLIESIVAICFLLYMLFGLGMAKVIYHTQNELYVKAFFTVVIVVMVCLAIGYIVESISKLLAIKEGELSPKVLQLILARTIFDAVALISAGFVFLVCGVMLLKTAPGSALLVIALGLIPISIGVLETIANYVFYKEFHTQVTLEKSSKYLFVEAMKEQTYLLLTGVVLALVPVLMIDMCIATPDIDFLAIVVVIGMGLLFGAGGVALIVFTVKKIKKNLE